jgi:hypothetical protein
MTQFQWLSIDWVRDVQTCFFFFNEIENIYIYAKNIYKRKQEQRK